MNDTRTDKNTRQFIVLSCILSGSGISQINTVCRHGSITKGENFHGMLNNIHVQLLHMDGPYQNYSWSRDDTGNNISSGRGDKE